MYRPARGGRSCESFGGYKTISRISLTFPGVLTFPGYYQFAGVLCTSQLNPREGGGGGGGGGGTCGDTAQEKNQ